MESLGALITSHPLWLWLAIGALLLAVEVLTGSGWLLWPAASAGVVAIIAMLTPFGPAAQAVIFAILTIASTYVGRRFIRGAPASSPDVNDASTRLIGHHGKASEAFTGGSGRVFVDGKEWSARLEGSDSLAAGAAVEVVAVLSGARLMVRPA